MNRKELREAWLQELEQHPERQLVGHLGTQFSSGEEKYCCLGQLCKLVVPTENTRYTNGPDDQKDIHFFDSSLVLPSEVCDLVGLRSTGGDLEKPVEIRGRTHGSLSGMNDGGLTWPEIAAYIRENPKNVFVD